jgi:thioredoxin 1
MNSRLPASFPELIRTEKRAVLVDFYADWCGPCKMVSPAIARAARELSGEVLTIKVDVDKKPQIASAYQVSSIPTIMLFKNGRPIMRLQGAHPYGSLIEQIRKALASSQPAS